MWKNFFKTIFDAMARQHKIVAISLLEKPLF